MTKPSPLGLKKSFGFGDRLGVATPGHLASARKTQFAPIFAQQSIREMTRTQRTAGEVMKAAADALEAAQFRSIWGADADHLKTPEDIQTTAAAGFTFFTIDPSSFVNNAADTSNGVALGMLAGQIEKEGLFQASDYLGKKFDLGVAALEFDLSSLQKAAVKYARAISHTANMAAEIRKHRSDADIEVSVDETDFATTPLEHYFVANELKRRGIAVTSLAPRFVGEFEKGVDYKGDLQEFEKQLAIHVAIAQQLGPYKISIHSGSDKFSVYPVIGRLCGDLLHVKTAGTSYLEALRAVCRTDSELFGEIAAFAHSRFSVDRASYHISTTNGEVSSLVNTKPEAFEENYLDGRAGRQLLHVTFGSVLTVGTTSKGRSFREAILESLSRNAALHSELLEKHFDRHLSLLNAG
jgi:hypothetical protein